MASAGAVSARKGSQAKTRETVSLSSLLGREFDEAEALLQSASALEKQLLMAEFDAYHRSCLLSKIRIDANAISDLIRFTKSCVILIDYNLAVSKLVEIASYYENVGDIDSAVLLAEESLTFAQTTSDKALQRKAYSRLGACYSRQFDFEKACTCYEIALRLAITVGNPLYEFAVLSNVVTLFDAMGLVREASELAHKLSDHYPEGTSDLNLLHLQNSINGFRFATALKNNAEMKYFHACASRKMRSVGEVPKIWKAYFNANTITHLIHDGKLEEAKDKLAKWAKSESNKPNVRVTVSLLAASVECAIAMADSPWLSELEQSLCEALNNSKAYPPDNELVLSLLAQVHEHNTSDQGSSLAIIYVRRLQDHIVNVRHRQFFGRLSNNDVLSSRSTPILVNPVYDLTTSMFEVNRGDEKSLAPNSYRSDEFFAELEGKFWRSAALSEERDLRSTDYCIAENWAVAAEFGSNDDGAHCFLVGTLAYKIAKALNFDSARSLEIELACRLHDIGKIGIPTVLVNKVPEIDWHHSVYLREHSTVGERLLQSSSDPVLILAASVARSHHEWWNGFGFPDSLLKEDIPVEARICAVASEYSALVGGRSPRTSWSHDEAMSQITTMAGVQFDPSIVQALLSVKDLNSCFGGLPGATGKLDTNSLKLAKTKLDACVASI